MKKIISKKHPGMILSFHTKKESKLNDLKNFLALDSNGRFNRFKNSFFFSAHFYHSNNKNMKLAEMFKLIDDFIKFTNKHNVKMMLIGGGAVNVYGYERASRDVDFWIDGSVKNLSQLKTTLEELNFDFKDFPDKVKKQEQNIGISFSPTQKIELIPFPKLGGISFSEAWEKSIKIKHKKSDYYFRCISYKHLLITKLRAGRVQDLADVSRLKEIRKKRNQ